MMEQLCSDQNQQSSSKTSLNEISKNIKELLEKHPDLPHYDRPEDDGQHRLASKTPGSKISSEKHPGMPSWKRYTGD